MIYGRCQTCKKKRFFIRKRSVILPTGDIALSRKLMCRKCYKVINRALQFK